MRAGLVSDVGRFNDRSFNQSALEGLRRAESELEAEGRPIESHAASDYVPNLSTLARQNFDVTIAVGFLMAEALHTVANRFPDANFAIVDYSVNAAPFTKNENVQGLIFASNEAGCLVGHLAAKTVEQQGGAQVISAVGGIKLPTVDIFIAGYQFCAKRANPDVKVLIGYSQDFVAQDKCKEVALSQIGEGSQVVFQVAGGCGLGALDAAQEEGKWGIGVDKDQASLGPHILTSAVKRVDTSVFETVMAVHHGSFEGGSDVFFNLENEGSTSARSVRRSPRNSSIRWTSCGSRSLRATSRFLRRSRIPRQWPRPPPTRLPSWSSGASRSSSPACSPTTTLTSIFVPARCMRCSARTEPASRP